MRCLIACLIGLLLCGCSTSPKYLEGSNMSIGAYLPVDGQLLGIEVINYLNGVKVQCSSNQNMKIERDFCSTNTYLWGMVEIKEKSKTKIETK